MEGNMKITYVVICDNDFEKTITGEELLADERVVKAIKSAFGDSGRNIEMQALCEAAIKLKTTRTEYSLEIPKDDFADALTLAEEDAKKNRRLKKGCERVMLADIETI
ncbi:MAG: hypothetical protein WC691_12375 [Sulfuricurvum sp.]